jgi:hypothetical protein
MSEQARVFLCVAGTYALILIVAITTGLAGHHGEALGYAIFLLAFALLAVALSAAGLLSFTAAHTIQALPRLFAEIYFRLNPSPEGWWLAQLGIALCVMFPTTFALGWVFPLVLEAVGGGGQRIASSVGRVYAANTMGTILGAASGGFLLIPLLGVGTTLVGVAVGQILLGAVLMPGATAGLSRPRTLTGLSTWPFGRVAGARFSCGTQPRSTMTIAPAVKRSGVMTLAVSGSFWGSGLLPPNQRAEYFKNCRNL